jgi:hypothetical protein
MRIERATVLVIASVLIASSVAHAQTPPPAAPKSSQKAPPAPRPAPPRPPPPAPTAAPTKPKPPPPKVPPAKNPEDEAIIEQLELFMLMEMMKDYEILRETER